MNARFLSIGFCVIFVAVYLGYSHIIEEFADRRAELRRYHEKLATDKESEWRAQSELLQQELVRKRNDLAEQQQQDLAQAFGGPMKAIVNDPRLSLTQMIRAVGAQAAPAGTRVQVRVDRFIDFQLHLDLPASVDQSAIVLLVTEVLRETSDYLSSLICVRSGEIVAELTRDEIQSIFDWNAADAEAVAKLSRNQEEQRATPAFDTTGTTRLTNVLPQERARIAFAKRIDEALEEVKKAVDLQNRALDLRGLRTKDFSGRREQIAEAKAMLRGAAATLEEPTAAYEALLRQEGLPNAAIEGIIVPLRKALPPTRDLRRVIELFQARAAAGAELFNILDRHQQGWDPDGTGEYFTFNSESVAEQVRHQQRLLSEETVALEKALRRWADQPSPAKAETNRD